MEETTINLEGAYNQIKEEEPLPWTGNCLSCGKKLVTEARASYQPEKIDRIDLYRPAHCPNCAEGLREIEVKVFASINQEGEVIPKNKKGRIE